MLKSIPVRNLGMKKAWVHQEKKKEIPTVTKPRFILLMVPHVKEMSTKWNQRSPGWRLRGRKGYGMLLVFDCGYGNWRLNVPDGGRQAGIGSLQRATAQATLSWGSLYCSRLRQWYHTTCWRLGKSTGTLSKMCIEKLVVLTVFSIS